MAGWILPLAGMIGDQQKRAREQREGRESTGLLDDFAKLTHPEWLYGDGKPLGWTQFLAGGGGNTDKAREKALADIMAEYDGIQVPVTKDYTFERPNYVGDVNPVRMDALNSLVSHQMDSVQNGPSAYDDVSIDPRLLEQQKSSLAALQNISDAGGLTLTDEANLNRINSEIGQANRGRQEAIMQNLQARGMGGSGMELLQRQMASQAAATDANQRGLDVAAGAQERALQAMMQGGRMAGEMANEDFARQARRADATDAINRFNAANQQAANRYNTEARNSNDQFNQKMNWDTNRYNTDNINQANISNRNARQDNMNRRADVTNENMKFNYGVGQDSFKNQMDLADSRAGVKRDVYGYVDEKGKRRDRQDADMMDTVLKFGSTLLED